MSTAAQLRPPRAEDLAALFGWRNDAELQRLLMWRRGPLDEVALRAWIDRRTRDPEGLFFVVADARDRAVGFAQLTRMHRADGHAHLGLLIDAAVRGAGVAAAALEALEAHARGAGLHKLLLEVLEANRRAVRFYEKCGYRRVGVLEEHFSDGGERHHVIVMERILR